MPKNTKTYPHITIKENKKTLKHKHPTKIKGSLTVETIDGKILKITHTAKTQITAKTAQKDFLSQKCEIFQIVSGLHVAIWKNNPDKGFFYITGNKNSVHFRNRDLKHGVNAILRVLKYTKKAKTRVLSISNRKLRESKKKLQSIIAES